MWAGASGYGSADGGSQQIDQNYQRARDVQAAIDGQEAAEPSTDPATQMQAAFFTAANFDPNVARCLLAVFSTSYRVSPFPTRSSLARESARRYPPTWEVTQWVRQAPRALTSSA